MRETRIVTAHARLTRNPVLILTLLLSLLSVQFVWPAEVKAAPVLSVSTSVSQPLLGGTATVSVTVSNTGDEKGYNLSLSGLLGSSLPDPDGRVTVGTASVAPTSVRLDPATGDTALDFFDMVDLAPSESYTLTFEVSLAGDPVWEVGQRLTAAISARVNTVPDNSGAWISGAGAAQAEVIPVDLVYKRANQSTSTQQDLGTTTRGYSYTLLVQNNYVNPSASVVVTDTLPDGVEFLGMNAGPALDAGYPQRDPASGKTYLKWTIGAMAPGATVSITYGAGLRYDYYGTDNGGTNRIHDDFTSAPASAAVIPHKTGFVNAAGLRGEYRGSLPATITPTDSDSASVEGAYITIDKSGTPSTGGYGTVVEYTLTYATSEYHTADGLVVTDTLPDGLTYVVGSASTPPTSVTHEPDGATVLVWSSLPPLATTGHGAITFRATVDTTWEQPGHAGEPIRAGDSMRNAARLATDWYDQVDTDRTGSDTLVAEVAATLDTGLPAIDKAVWDPDTGTWVDSIDARVGDRLLYRLRFNTTDGVGPIRSDISLGYITLTDWLPPGTVYNGDAHPVHAGTFSLPASAPPASVLNPDVPNTVTLGALTGLEWFLGDVSANGWWETTFTVTVQDLPVVQQGLKTGNHWKLTGVNTFGQEYSDRDIAPLDYVEPQLVLDKTASAVPVPLVAGSSVGYTITIDNVGAGAAEDIVVTDHLPVGMRDATPTVTSVSLDGTPLAPGSWSTGYSPATGRLDIDLAPAAPGTPIPAGSRLVVTLESRVDAATGAGTTLTNIATVAYNTQSDGSGRQVPGTTVVADPNTDDATVTLTGASIAKTGPAGPIRIGDAVTYDLDVTIPAGAIVYWPRIVDRLSRDGVWYVAGSASITTIAGAPPAAAAFDTTSTPVRTQQGTANRTDLTWNLANPIDNRGQSDAYRFRLRFSVQYTGVRDDGTMELYPPGANDTLTNQYGRFEWNTQNTTTRPGAPNSNTQSGSAVTHIDQPVLALQKMEVSSGPYAGGSAVTYRVVLTNPRHGATAYDLDWEDVLPAYCGSPALVSVTHSALGDISSSVSADFGTLPRVAIDFGGVSLAQGASITIVYTVDIDPDVPAGMSLTNVSDVDWSTLPGTPEGSRRYDDAAWESYTGDTDDVTISVSQPSIAKTVVGPDPARIGDTVSYRMRVTVPAETVLPDAYLVDTIASDGFTYVPGSAIVQHVSGTPETAAVISGVTFDDALAPGSTLRVDLTSDVDNSSALAGVGDTPYVFDVLIDFVYDGVADGGQWTFFPAGPADAITDTAALHWTINGVSRSITDAATTRIAQPRLTLQKSEWPVAGPYDGGDTVGYRAIITNTGWAPAYNMSWEDLLSGQMSAPSVTAVTHSALGDILAVVTPDQSSDDRVSIDFGSIVLAPGETVTVEWTATIDPGTGAGLLLTDTADVDWDSHPTSPARRVFNDGPSEASWTADTDQATVRVDTATLMKTVESGITTRTVGETFDYTVAFSIPASTTAYNVTVTDVVPDGLTVLDVTPSAAIGSVMVGPELLGRTTVVWNIGDVSNPPTDALSLTISVRVDEAFFSGSPVNGLPATVDGDGTSTLVNEASIVWDDAATGGTTHSSTDTVTVDAVEPHLTIVKSVDGTELAAGETARYTVTVHNDGPAPAHDVRWSDTVPGMLFSVGTSPALASVRIDGTPLAPGTDYTALFGSSVTSSLDLVVPLASGSTLSIVYDATLAGGVPSGASLVNVASVDGYSSMPGVVPGERVYGSITDTQTVTTRAPHLKLTKQALGDTQVQRGEHTRFSITIENDGTATARSVVLTDTLPVGLTFVVGSVSGLLPGTGAYTGDPSIVGQDLVWDFGGALDLAPGQVASLVFEASVDDDAPLGMLTNVAMAEGEDGAGSSIPPTDDTDGVLVTDPRVAIVKRLADGQDPFVQVGETVDFTIVVTNTGSTRLDTVRVEDAFDPTFLVYRPTGTVPAADSAAGGTLVWNDVTGAGSLAAGQSTTMTVSFNVTARPPASVTTNVARITSATDEYGDEAPPTSSNADAGITGPGTTVDKRLATGQADTVSVGETVTFDIAVTNSGDTTIAALGLADTYDPAVFAFESATPDVSSSGAGVLNWADLTTHFGDIAPGGVVHVALTLRSIGPGANSVDTASVTSAVDVNGDPAATSSDTATATVVAPRLEIDKAVSTASAGPGDVVGYTVTVRNVGDGPACDVVLTDAIPAELWAPVVTSVRLDGVTPLVLGVDYLLDLSSPTAAHLTFTSPLGAGHEIAIAYDATLAGGTSAGRTLTNTAGVVYSSLPGTDPHEGVYGPETATGSIVTRAPALAIDKSVVGDTEAQAGQEVTYRVTVSNTGDAPARAVTVTDVLPDGLSYVPGSTSASWSGGGASTADPSSGTPVAWAFGGAAWIAPGESAVLEFRAVVTAQSATGVKTNAARAGATDGGGTGLSPVDDNADVLVTHPLVAIDKHLAAGQDPFVQVGDTVTFEIVVTNTGTTRLDTLPLNDVYDAAHLAYRPAATSPTADAVAPGLLGWADLTGAGSLLPGQATTVTVGFEVIGHPDTGSSVDTATVAGAVDEYGDPVPDRGDTAAVGITEPGVSIDKRLAAGQPPVVAVGDTVSFEIEVHNSGDTTLAVLPLDDHYDARLGLQSATPAPSGVTSSTVSWGDITEAFGDLAPGRSVTLVTRFTVLSAGPQLLNTADVRSGSVIDINGDEAPGDTDNQMVDAYVPDDVVLTKQADPPDGTIVLPGDTITYALTFENSTEVTLRDVLLTDELPGSVSYEAGSMALESVGATETLTDAADSDAGTFDGSSGPSGMVMARLGDVNPGEVWTLVFRVIVRPEDVSRAGVVNSATASMLGRPIAHAGPVAHPVDPFEIVKTGRDVNGGKLAPGDQIEWTIVVTNTGLTPTTHVVVRDTVPGETAYVTGSITGPGANDTDAPALVWDIDSMDVGASVTLTFRSTVKKGIPSGTMIRNQAVLTADQTRPKYSDFPDTTDLGDPTLLRTGGNDWVWLAAVAVMLLTGLVLFARRGHELSGRRRRRLRRRGPVVRHA